MKLSVKLIGYQFFPLKSLAIVFTKEHNTKLLTSAFWSSHTKITRFEVYTI